MSVAQKLILVIDDEPAIGRIIKVNLERRGYRVEISVDSVAALELLRNGHLRPDLILSDVTMPYMDGIELLTRVKSDPDLAAIPFVMVTARSRDADIIAGRERGALHYLTKPIVLEELFEVVEQTIGSAEGAESASQ
ncbi:MAG: response regulator [Chloroherpetonaceae bacterium]|nr:response regulator [Chthonomonadaceae bacterium]MDW8208219.1 response regulator [Chloroherpetonaceae bacterium]